MNSVLITGASSGIGHATARLLAESGYIVFAGVRTDHDLRRLAGEHLNLRPLILDVTKAADLRTATAIVREGGYPLHAVISNAGVAVAGPLEFLPVDALRRQYEINVFGPMALAQATLPLLRATRGRIIFIGSIAGRISAPFVGPYSSSKAALASLADALRQELSSFGIAVSLFEFASVKTPIWAKGRAAKDDSAASLGPAAATHYGHMIESLVAQTKREEHEGLEPIVVAEAIARALVAERPRARYLIGKKAKLQAIVAVLPAATRDRLIKQAMRLP